MSSQAINVQACLSARLPACLPAHKPQAFHDDSKRCHRPTDLARLTTRAQPHKQMGGYVPPP
jgi:hypothetical protein